MSEEHSSSTPGKNRVNLNLDLRVVVGVLLLVIIAMLALWRPWTTAGTSDRTVEVKGEATVKTEPDEFAFYPNYQYTNTDREKALAEATKKHADIVAKLKELGVADSKIKSDLSGFEKGMYYPVDDSRAGSVYTSTITVTVGSKDQAQKVQDYLVTTSPTGNVTPNGTFSEGKRKELEAQARDEATKDDRKKAEQSGKNLGFKIGKVKSVSDGAGFDGGIRPMMARGVAVEDTVMSAPASISVQPGENELHYSVTVVYYVR